MRLKHKYTDEFTPDDVEYKDTHGKTQAVREHDTRHGGVQEDILVSVSSNGSIGIDWGFNDITTVQEFVELCIVVDKCLIKAGWPGFIDQHDEVEERLSLLEEKVYDD